MGLAVTEWRNGWTVVLAGAAGAATSSVQTVALSILMKPLGTEFGWSRGQISLSFTITTVGALILSPFVGHLVDRFGPRRVALVGVSAKMLTLGAIALSTSALWTWYMLWTIFAAVAPAASVVVWTKAVTSRFHSSRGLALALTLCGMSVGNGLFSLYAAHLYLEYGWRGVYVGLAATALFVAFVLTWLFFYDAEDLAASRSVKVPARRVDGPAIRGALANPKLWQIIMPTFLAAASIGGLTIHLLSLLTDAGMPVGTAALAFSLAFGPCAFVGRVTTGTFLDRFHPPLVAACAFALPAIASLFLISGGNILSVIGAICVGAALGAELEVLAYLLSRYFPPKLYGTLYGIGYGIYALGYGSGPMLAAISFDRLGSYQPYLWGILTAAMIGIPTILTVGRTSRF